MVSSNDKQRLQGESDLVPNNNQSLFNTHEQQEDNRIHSTGFERQGFNQTMAFLPPPAFASQNPSLQSNGQLQSPLSQSATFPAHLTPVFAPIYNTSHVYPPQEHQQYQYHQSASQHMLPSTGSTQPVHQNTNGQLLQQQTLQPQQFTSLPEPPLFTVTSSTFHAPPQVMQMFHQNLTFPMQNAIFPSGPNLANVQFPHQNSIFPVHTAHLAPLYDAYLQAQYASKQPRQDDWTTAAGRNSNHQQPNNPLSNQRGNHHQQNNDSCNSSFSDYSSTQQNINHSGSGNDNGYSGYGNSSGNGNINGNINGNSNSNGNNYAGRGSGSQGYNTNGGSYKNNSNHYRKNTWNKNNNYNNISKSYSSDQSVSANNQAAAGNGNNTRVSAATSGNNEPSVEHQAGKHVYIVQFKQYCKEYLLSYRAPDTIKVGDIVVVAADRGEDIGEVVEILPLAEFYKNRDKYNNNQSNNSNIHNSSGFVRVVSDNSMGSINSLKSNATSNINNNNNSCDNSGVVSPAALHEDSTAIATATAATAAVAAAALYNHYNKTNSCSSVDTYDTQNSWSGAAAVGAVTHSSMSNNNFNSGGNSVNGSSVGNSIMSPAVGANSEYVRPLGRLLRLATEQELAMLQKKSSDELKIISYAQNLIATVYHFNMQIMDAEYQFDRQKLTLFYATVDNARIDFRDFVKNMYAVYKVRIWMERL